jgi:hypothetical protein
VATGSGEKAQFNIINKSGDDIDSLWIDHSAGGLQCQERSQLAQNDSVYYEMKMPTGYSDGDYTLWVYKKGNLAHIHKFGYYTNSAQMEKEYDIIIRNDTIIERASY